MKERLSLFYNKNYKKVLVLPAILIILSLAYLAYFYSQNNDFVKRDVSLTGGTTITFSSTKPVSEFQSALAADFPDISVMSLSNNSGRQTGLIITTKETTKEIRDKLIL